MYYLIIWKDGLFMDMEIAKGEEAAKTKLKEIRDAGSTLAGRPVGYPDEELTRAVAFGHCTMYEAIHINKDTPKEIKDRITELKRKFR